VLTGDERTDVEGEVATVLSGSGRTVCKAIFGIEADAVLVALPEITDWPTLAYELVTYCVRSRWTKQPALLDLLLTYLINIRGVGRYQPILARVQQQVDPNPDPYKMAWLGGGHPLIDRGDLRTHIRVLVEQDARALLRVNAAPETFGRSYSRRFLQHIEDTPTVDTHIVAEELTRGTGPSYQITDLAGALAAQLGVTNPVPGPTGSLYPRSLAQWVLGNFGARRGKWIIFLDGFGQPGLNPEVKQMIEAFAMLIPTGTYRKKVRLVLIDYPHALPQVSPLDMLEEDLRPVVSLTKDDLMPCIIEWDAVRLEQKKQQLPAGDLPELAARMIQRAPAAGKERLEFFNQQLRELFLLQ
jgi:hypothetical protein